MTGKSPYGVIPEYLRIRRLRASPSPIATLKGLSAKRGNRTRYAIGTERSHMPGSGGAWDVLASAGPWALPEVAD